MAAQALAKLCCETLYADGLDAATAVDANAVTPALDRIVEANMLLSATSRRLKRPTSMTSAINPTTPNLAASEMIFSNLTRKTATVVAIRPRGCGGTEVWVMFLGYPPRARISVIVR